jgi:aminoglycoside phosphotransferase (APT) family kinase protein
VTSAIFAAAPPRAGGDAVRQRSLSEFVRDSGLKSLVVGTSKDPNAKITVLLVSPGNGGSLLAVKAPTTDAAARAVEAEERALLAIRRAAPRDVADTIPRVIDAVEFDGRRAVVFSAVRGTPMATSYIRWRHTASKARVAADFAAVEAWLIKLQRGTAGESAPIEMGGDVALRLRRRFPDDVLLDADLNQLAEINRRLSRNSVPRTAVHGDLWFGNLLLEGQRVSGVVDWEAGTTSGEPVRDLVRFAHMYALYLDRRTRPRRRIPGHSGLRADRWGVGVEFAINGAGWFPELFRQFLQRGLTRLGAPAADWRDAAVAGIAEVAAVTDDREFARRHLDLFRRLCRAEQTRENL